MSGELSPPNAPARFRRLAPWPALLGLLAALLAAPGPLAAEPPPSPPVGEPGGEGEAPPAPKEVTAEIRPVLTAQPEVLSGWTEILVRVQNTGSRPVRGEARALAVGYGGRAGARARAPFVVPAGGTAVLTLPLRALEQETVEVEVDDEAGARIAEARIGVGSPSGQVFLLDVSDPSPLRGALEDVPVAPRYTPLGRTSGPGGSARLLVGAPRFDPATGDPILPAHAAGYGQASAVILRSSTLARLSGKPLEALANFVLAGGTLAVAVTRPEDLRSGPLVPLLGGEVREAPEPSAETMKPFALPAPSGSAGEKAPPAAAAPGPELAGALSGYEGGNLAPSLYGASAAYGLGEVHLLAFDPTKKPAVDDPFALARLVDLGRRAYDRRSGLAFPVVGEPDRAPKEVATLLDPNERAPLAIGVSALLLVVYAIGLGPLNFGLASRKGKPLRALVVLPVLAALAFSAVLAVGAFFRGTGGRARKLALVEAGAGMGRATARRFRGFFVSSSESLTVRSSDGASVLGTAALDPDAPRDETLVVDRDGTRLEGMRVPPWQIVLAEELGFAELGEGLSVRAEGADLAVVNRTGRKLLGVVVKPESGDPAYFGALGDGEKVLHSAGTPVASMPDGIRWVSALSGSVSAYASFPIHALRGDLLAPVLDAELKGLGSAWKAFERAAGGDVDWFPDGVPVVLAQVEGGEGRTRDAGLRLESDRTLLRVVGYGGRP